jgi:hypothetical protein
MQIYNIFKKYKPIIIVKRKKGKPIQTKIKTVGKTVNKEIFFNFCGFDLRVI